MKAITSVLEIGIGIGTATLVFYHLVIPVILEHFGTINYAFERWVNW